MRSARTRLASIEERTLRIGFGIKRSSEGKEGLPQLLALREPLLGRQSVPFRPFLTGHIFGAYHVTTVARSGRLGKCRGRVAADGTH